MSQRSDPDTGDPDTHPSDTEIGDPDIAYQGVQRSAFAFGDATPIGETDRIAREKAIYEAGRRGNSLNRGHAIGGTDGSTEGQ
ncbi:MAG: hypothetical protein QM673_16155 [Gordonia sp. (in: high G+C Gram-positive bacteria)]